MKNHLSYWALVLSIFTLFIFSGIAVATEEPKFSLLEKDQSFELRLYEPKIIAEVEVDGDMSAASRKGFRQIADFIFGNNTAQSGKSEKISMTAPVAIKPASEKIAMTAPVGVQQSEKGWKVSFVMPSQYTLETLPKPNNPQISIKQLPAKKFALIRFSGLVDEEKMQAKSAELNQWITMKKLNPVGIPELARYNPPWTLPFLRRNELMIEVE
ncbi:MAG: heme-binding protein [Methylophilaceae bacterium]|nr:heme-binding protein [Methylophilaceae bacterium]